MSDDGNVYTSKFDKWGERHKGWYCFLGFCVFMVTIWALFSLTGCAGQQHAPLAPVNAAASAFGALILSVLLFVVAFGVVR